VCGRREQHRYEGGTGPKDRPHFIHRDLISFMPSVAQDFWRKPLSHARDDAQIALGANSLRLRCSHHRRYRDVSNKTRYADAAPPDARRRLFVNPIMNAEAIVSSKLALSPGLISS
jgi:hypothetical protein